MSNRKERLITLAMVFGLVSESVRQVVANPPANSETIVFNALMNTVESRKKDNDDMYENATVDSPAEGELVEG